MEDTRRVPGRKEDGESYPSPETNEAQTPAAAFLPFTLPTTLGPMPSTIGIDYRPALLSSAGIGRSVRELCRGLGVQPHLKIRLFGHSVARARRNDPIPVGTTLHRLPIPGRGLPLLARIGLDGGRLCGGVSVFHLTDYVYPPISSAPTILTIHDLAFFADPEFHGRRQSAHIMQRCRVAAGRAAHIICPTHATAGMVEKHLGVEPSRITVIPFGCDHVTRAPGPALVDEPYILTVGTVEPRKNHLTLLRAWRSLPDPRPRLIVAGARGWECSETVQELLDAEANDKLTWLEAPDDAEIYNLMAHARVLAYPSSLEGFGFPPLEAMSLGTPVLAGDPPALREVLGDGALLVAPRDVDALREQLLRVLTDDALHEELGRKGRIRAAKFTWNATARMHADVYRSCANGQRP